MKKIMHAAMLMAALATPALAGAPAKPAQAQADEVKVTAPPSDARPTLDVVFVLDTTSSMGGLIEGAKQKIWSIASRMAEGKPTPHIRVGLVGFRDRGDAYETRRFDLSDDLDTVYKNLQGFRAEGGGDGPEHVGKGLGEAVKFMAWSDSKKASRMIFLVGDAPAHDDYGDEWNTKVWAKNAIQKGIVVNTIRCGDSAETQGVFQTIASLADGSFTSIGQSGGMVATATPYDAEIGKLNAAIASKSVFTGSSVAREEGKKNAEAQAALPASAAADRAYFMVNSTRSVAPRAAVGSVDLAAAPEKLKEVKTEALPEPLQKMKPEEREAYVKQQAAERQELEKKMQTLATKRGSWISENAKKDSVSFDDEVFKSVKKSAAKAGVAY